jgi:hypothetical protein
MSDIKFNETRFLGGWRPGEEQPMSRAQLAHMRAESERYLAANPEPKGSPYYVPPAVVEVVAEVVAVATTAVEWLQAFIADGPKPAKEVFAMAKATAGYGRKAILTAQRKLGIKPVQRARAWLWGLPGWEDENS